MRLANKVALITGGGSGIGRASALLFAKEGSKVVVSDMRQPSVTDTVDQIRAAGGEAVGVSGDVSRGSDAERMVDTAVASYGKLDVLLNSAGISARNALGPDASAEAVWDRVMDVNLKGTYLVSRHAVEQMRLAGGGSIVNLASIMALVGYAGGLGSGLDPYPPSKGGVLQFTRNLAIEMAKDNIRVNCICPGYVDTDLIQRITSDEQLMEALVAKHPMGRLGRPEEIAYAALYLASDESAFVTGAPLVVDGGYTAQ